LVGYLETPSLAAAKAGMEKKRDQCQVAGGDGGVFLWPLMANDQMRDFCN